MAAGTGDGMALGMSVGAGVGTAVDMRRLRLFILAGCWYSSWCSSGEVNLHPAIHPTNLLNSKEDMISIPSAPAYRCPLVLKSHGFDSRSVQDQPGRVGGDPVSPLQ